MELPGLGKQCAVESCKELDFLPVTCTYCGLIFCGKHFPRDEHDCKGGESEVSEPKVEIERYICSVKECGAVGPVEIICEKCKKNFCLSHRHHGCFDKTESELAHERVLWNAPRKQFDEHNSAVQSQINEKLQKAQLKPKSSKIAHKLQLMKIKGKAIGEKNIPQVDRIYFLILFPLKLDKKPECVFVSKSWTVGRVIDSVCSLSNVINKNNVSTADKFRLFFKTCGKQITTTMETKMNDLLTNNIIVDGDVFILDYVPNNSPVDFCLIDTTIYKDFF